MNLGHRSLGSAAAVAAILLAIGATGCTAKESKPDAAGASTPVSVNATDTGCALSTTEGAKGSTTFAITNNGTKTTEVYVYGDGGRVIGEAENISPGLQQKLTVDLTEPGSYTIACKPGMVGDGIRTDFTVKA